MKQENGAELLGMNDPRSANIGIIYVDPTDDRRRVLAAILTQEKLGRKQIAIVLPPQNKAFQRPSDFDDLKTVRRNLEAQIVFIAPSGPGPAEFARQRHFAVYSTLENFATALREGNVSGGVKKGGWLFHRGKQSLADDLSSVGTRLITSDSGGGRLDSKQKLVNTPPGAASTASVPPQSSMPAHSEDDDDQDIHTDPLKSMARGAAAFGAGMLVEGMAGANPAPTDMSSHHEDDWDALPPTGGSPGTGQRGAGPVGAGLAPAH